MNLLKLRRSRVLGLIRDKASGEGGAGITTFLNPYSYLIVRERVGVLEGFDRVCCDGILLVLALKAIGINVKRASFDFTSLAPVVFNELERNGGTVYFIGTKEGVIQTAVETIQKRFPRLNVCGVRNGYFASEGEYKAVLEQVKLLSPSVVVAGLGTPLQEKFLLDLRAIGWRGDGYTCGGFLHQTASKGIQYYPAWVDRLNLRWLYRIFDEPKLVTRYLWQYPKFVVLFFYDSIFLKM